MNHVPRADPQRPTCFAVRVWSAILRTAARAGLTRRDPLEDEPAAVRDGTGRINLFDFPSFEELLHVFSLENITSFFYYTKM